MYNHHMYLFCNITKVYLDIWHKPSSHYLMRYLVSWHFSNKPQFCQDVIEFSSHKYIDDMQMLK